MLYSHNYIIYKAQNLFTNEVYIGATTTSLHQRRLDHTERATRQEQGKFYEAIGTYGPEAFSWEQIDSATTMDELAQKEKYFIIEYYAQQNGYNSDSGGGFKKTVYQYDVDTGEIINTFETLKDAGNAVNASRKSINNVCLGVNKTCKGFYWSYDKDESFEGHTDHRKKMVCQLDLNSVLINTYESVAQASMQSGISKTCISRVCRGEREQSGGFIWKYN